MSVNERVILLQLRRCRSGVRWQTGINRLQLERRLPGADACWAILDIATKPGFKSGADAIAVSAIGTRQLLRAIRALGTPAPAGRLGARSYLLLASPTPPTHP